jgi:hypothetical protein
VPSSPLNYSRRLGSNLILSFVGRATSSDLTSCDWKVRVWRGFRGRPLLEECAGRIGEGAGAEKVGSPKKTSSNAAGDGRAPLSQGLGRILSRWLPSVSLIDLVLVLAVVKKSPCLASRVDRSCRSTRGGGRAGRSMRVFLMLLSGIRVSDGVGKLMGAVTSDGGCERCWERGGAGLESFDFSCGESIEWIAENFCSIIRNQDDSSGWMDSHSHGCLNHDWLAGELYSLHP